MTACTFLTDPVIGSPRKELNRQVTAEEKKDQQAPAAATA
jgi:hypothetical protein